MKIIFNNMYIKSFKFESFREFSSFINNQKGKTLSLEQSRGDIYYCYIFHHALTQEKLLMIHFCSDRMENNLSLLVWNNNKLIALDTGSNIYFINEEYNITTSFEITTPLIGLYQTNGNNLLILEEADLKLVTPNGHILKNESFDVIENFTIENNVISIKTNEKTMVFELS